MFISLFKNDLYFFLMLFLPILKFIAYYMSWFGVYNLLFKFLEEFVCYLNDLVFEILVELTIKLSLPGTILFMETLRTIDLVFMFFFNDYIAI